MCPIKYLYTAPSKEHETYSKKFALCFYGFFNLLSLQLLTIFFFTVLLSSPYPSSYLAAFWIYITVTREWHHLIWVSQMLLAQLIYQ